MPRHRWYHPKPRNCLVLGAFRTACRPLASKATVDRVTGFLCWHQNRFGGYRLVDFYLAASCLAADCCRSPACLLNPRRCLARGHPAVAIPAIADSHFSFLALTVFHRPADLPPADLSRSGLRSACLGLASLDSVGLPSFSLFLRASVRSASHHSGYPTAGLRWSFFLSEHQSPRACPLDSYPPRNCSVDLGHRHLDLVLDLRLTLHAACLGRLSAGCPAFRRLLASPWARRQIGRGRPTAAAEFRAGAAEPRRRLSTTATE